MFVVCSLFLLLSLSYLCSRKLMNFLNLNRFKMNFEKYCKENKIIRNMGDREQKTKLAYFALAYGRQQAKKKQISKLINGCFYHILFSSMSFSIVNTSRISLDVHQSYKCVYTFVRLDVVFNNKNIEFCRTCYFVLLPNKSFLSLEFLPTHS